VPKKDTQQAEDNGQQHITELRIWDKALKYQYTAIKTSHSFFLGRGEGGAKNCGRRKNKFWMGQLIMLLCIL